MTRDEFLERNRRLEETLKALHSASAQEAEDPSHLDRLRSAGDDLKVRAAGLRERFDDLDRPKATAIVILAMAGVVAIAVAITGTFLGDGTNTTTTGGVSGNFAAAVADPSSSSSSTTQCVTTTTTAPADPSAEAAGGVAGGDVTCQSDGVTTDGSVNGTMPDGTAATNSTESATIGPNGRRTTTTRPGTTAPQPGGLLPPPDSGGGVINPTPTSGVVNPTTPDPTTTDTTTPPDPTTTDTTTPPDPTTPESPLLAPDLPMALPAEPIAVTITDPPPESPSVP